MITACKSYITNDDTATIWNQPLDSVMEKLHAAIRLKQVGRKVRRKTEYKVRFKWTWLAKLLILYKEGMLSWGKMKQLKNILWHWAIFVRANGKFSPVSDDLLETGFPYLS